MYKNRILGRYSQNLEGPLLVVLCAMHGNEPAGVHAVNHVIHLLNNEKKLKPEFKFRGSFIGIIANLEALNQNKRFIHKDLNRSWSYESYKEIILKSKSNRHSEEQQVVEIIEALRSEIEIKPPDQIIVLDLHTTSAHGGIFSIITDDPLSEKIAIELHAPVVKGMLNGINGSSIHFFHGQNMGINTTAIGFECGQHEDVLSVHRGIAAIINCMRTISCVDAHDVENKHDEILIQFSRNLPKVNQIVDKYAIKNIGNFQMLPGFKSFDEVFKGQLLAHDGSEAVYSSCDARILMPFYQKMGEDGYFLIKSET